MKVFILSALCLASALAEPEADALNAYTYVNYGGKMMPVTRYNGFRPHEFRPNTYTGFPNTFTGFPNTYTGRPNTYTGYAVGSPYPGYPFATPSYAKYPSDTSFYNNRVSYNTVSGFRAPFLNRVQREAEPGVARHPGGATSFTYRSPQGLKAGDSNRFYAMTHQYRTPYHNCHTRHNCHTYNRPSTYAYPGKSFAFAYNTALSYPSNYQTMPFQQPLDFSQFSGKTFQLQDPKFQQNIPSFPRQEQDISRFFTEQQQGNPSFPSQDQDFGRFFPRQEQDNNRFFPSQEQGNPAFPRQQEQVSPFSPRQQQGNPVFPRQEQGIPSFPREGQFPREDQFQGQANPSFTGQGIVSV